MKKIFIASMILTSLYGENAKIDVLFECTINNNEKIILEGKKINDTKYIRIQNANSKWEEVDNIDAMVYNNSYARGARTEIVINNLDNCLYVFEDNIIARKIGEAPSHDVTKTVYKKCGKKVVFDNKCLLNKDGAKKNIYKYFRQGKSEY